MITTAYRRAIGVFSSYQEAEAALGELHDAGFAMNQISVIAKNTDRLNQSSQIGETQVKDLANANHADAGVKTGAVAGGTVGGLTGLLVGLGTLAIPGVGPVILAGATASAIATAAAGSAIGAAAGGLAGGLIGLGIPEDQANTYHDSVINGDYLIIIDGMESELLLAEEILKRQGIAQWQVYSTPIGREVADPANRL